MQRGIFTENLLSRKSPFETSSRSHRQMPACHGRRADQTGRIHISDCRYPAKLSLAKRSRSNRRQSTVWRWRFLGRWFAGGRRWRNAGDWFRWWPWRWPGYLSLDHNTSLYATNRPFYLVRCPRVERSRMTNGSAADNCAPSALMRQLAPVYNSPPPCLPPPPGERMVRRRQACLKTMALGFARTGFAQPLDVTSAMSAMGKQRASWQH